MAKSLLALLAIFPLFVLSQLLPDTCSFNWPIDGPGSPEAFQQPPTNLQQALLAIDPNRIETIINTLVGFGTRSTLSDKVSNATYGIGGARDWLANEMRGFIASSGGRLSVEVQSYIQAPTSEIPVSTNISNVIATLTGTTDPSRVYVLSGHYDSRVTDVENFTGAAPGADDDASGVAVVLEALRVMSNLAGTGKGVRGTMIFVAVAGEEQGLFGSTFMAGQLKAAGADVQGKHSALKYEANFDRVR